LPESDSPVFESFFILNLSKTPPIINKKALLSLKKNYRT